MSMLRVGLIGAGAISEGVGKSFASHPQCRITAIADVSEKALATRSDQFAVPAASRYADADRMLSSERLDVVYVSTPNAFHAPHAIAALSAGCHVLCEKPMAMSATQARAMADAARAAGRRLMIDFSFRFRPRIWHAKRQADTGMLGDIYFARSTWLRRRLIPTWGAWFTRKELAGGGPLIDLGVHMLDLAMWFMGHPAAEWVLASHYDKIAAPLMRRENRQYDVEDFGVALIRLANGATIEIEASWTNHMSEDEIMETRILGSKGGILQRQMGEVEISVESADGVHSDIVQKRVPAVPSAAHHFINCILNDTPHTATAEEGLRVMEILDAIYESAASGQPVRVSKRS